MSENKQTRYRRKIREQGRCAHCGKPCAPYAECAERRAYKRAYYHRTKTVSFQRDLAPRSAARRAPRGPKRFWTTAEEKQLCALLDGFTPLSAICMKLQRTEKAIIGRCRKLGRREFVCGDVSTPYGRQRVFES
jgi:hypothetical protein